MKPSLIEREEQNLERSQSASLSFRIRPNFKCRQAAAAVAAVMVLGGGAYPCGAAAEKSNANESGPPAGLQEDAFGEDEAVELRASYVRPDYVEVERLRATKEIIVIPKSEIQEKGKRTVSDVLAKVPSVSVGATGMGEIDIRGQGSDQATRNIQVMLDGAPITTLVNHPVNTDYDVVPVEQIERIEIIPGGGSVLYGSGASGGIINITTNLRSMSEPKNTATLEWNSKEYRTSANLGGTFADNRFAYDFSASHLERDLYFRDTFRDSNYFSGGLRWNLTDKQSLVFRASRLEEDSQFVGNVSISKVNAEGENFRPAWKDITVGLDADGHKITKRVRNYLNGDRRLDTFNASYLNDISDDLRLSIDAFYNNGYFSGVDDENKVMNHDGHGFKAKADWDYSDMGSILIGADYTVQKASLAYDNYKLLSYKDKTYKRQPLHYNYEKDIYALYLLNTVKWRDFEFTQGARRELTQWKFDKADTTEGKGSGVSDRWNWAFELSAAWNYRESGRLYARYERGYTVPDGLQITDSRPAPDGSGKLMSATKAEDETFNLYEIGLRDQLPFTSVSLTGWLSSTGNQMNRFLYIDENSALNRQTLNYLKSRRWGADLSLVQTIGRLTLEESYAYTMGQTRCNSAEACRFLSEHRVSIDYASSGLQKVPKHKVYVRATYDFTDALSATAEYAYFGSYNNFMKKTDDANGWVIGDHSLVDLSMRWEASKYVTLFGGVTNLFNEDYWDYQSGTPGSSTVIPGAKRAFFIGLKGTY